MQQVLSPPPFLNVNILLTTKTLWVVQQEELLELGVYASQFHFQSANRNFKVKIW